MRGIVDKHCFAVGKGPPCNALSWCKRHMRKRFDILVVGIDGHTFQQFACPQQPHRAAFCVGKFTDAADELATDLIFIQRRSKDLRRAVEQRQLLVLLMDWTMASRSSCLR